MKAFLRQIRISPKKMNLVASLVRNKDVTEAIDTLKFTRKKSAPFLKKLIASALANAENNFNQNKDTLYIKEIVVTEGPTLKRGVPVSRGRMHPILKRTSHVAVKLAQKESAAKEETKEVKEKPVKTKKSK